MCSQRALRLFALLEGLLTFNDDAGTHIDALDRQVQFWRMNVWAGDAVHKCVDQAVDEVTRLRHGGVRGNAGKHVERPMERTTEGRDPNTTMPHA